MTFKQLIFILFVLTGILNCSQKSFHPAIKYDADSLALKQYQSSDTYKITYDMDSLPVFNIIHIDTLKKEISVNYFFISKEGKILGDTAGAVQYTGGYEALSSYCDSLYFNREDYDYNELRARAYYTILFDKNLKIKEIRIIKRSGYSNQRYNYDNLIKRILFSTEGKWIIYNNEKKYRWYFYYGSFNVK
jgi:hypothetical protein